MSSHTSPKESGHLVIRFFSVLRELVGSRHVQMQLDNPESVQIVLDRLAAHYPDIAPHRPSMRAAVNQEYVGEDFTVFNGDELAIITPVSGG